MTHAERSLTFKVVELHDNYTFVHIEMSYKGKKSKEELDELFLESDPVTVDDTEEELDMPGIDLNLEQVDSDATIQARAITERLSGYYFDQKYIDEHPYIPNKIMTETQNIRRLLKMLTINEKAQDSIISAIALSMSKSTLYQSLTSLQNSTLAIQKQLDELVTKLEDIFRVMQEECQKSFEEKDKEDDGSGKFVVKGSREFIEEMTARMNNRKALKEKQEEETA